MTTKRRIAAAIIAGLALLGAGAATASTAHASTTTHYFGAKPLTHYFG